MKQVYRKFEKIKAVSEWDIKTPQGWKPIKNIMKTIPYEMWHIKLENGDELNGADTHILYTENHEEIYLKDIKIGQLIETDTGYYKTIEIKNLNIEKNMYDVEVDSVEHEYYANNITSHNTTTVGIYALWYAMYNKDKVVAILANNAAMAKSILAEIKDAYEEMPEFLKPGVKEYNAHSVIFDNGCKIIARATSPNAIRGETINLLILDEFAHVDNHICEPFWTANYPTLTATEGQCIIISTPNGTGNLYFDIWQKAIRTENSFVPIKVDWWEVEGRDEEWKKETIKNIGLVKFNQEYNCQFQGSTITLIDADFIIKHLKSENPIATPDAYTKIWEYPKTGRKYVIVIDTSAGVGSDYSVMNVFDITEYPFKPATQVASYRRNTITPPAFSELLYDSAKVWNDAYIIGEINGLSKEPLSRLQEKEYENIYFDYDDESIGVYADRTSKPKACMWFKEELENGRIHIRDQETINEIGYFEEVKPGIYRAKEGKNNHDDMVMTGVWLALFLKSQYYQEEKDSWGINPYQEDEADGINNTEEEESLQAFISEQTEAIEYDNENWLMNDERNR